MTNKSFTCMISVFSTAHEFDIQTVEMTLLRAAAIATCAKTSRIGSRTKSNTFDSSDRLSDRSNEAFTRYDRRTDQSDRPVGPTGRSDDRNV